MTDASEVVSDVTEETLQTFWTASTAVKGRAQWTQLSMGAGEKIYWSELEISWCVSSGTWEMPGGLVV